MVLDLEVLEVDKMKRFLIVLTVIIILLQGCGRVTTRDDFHEKVDDLFVVSGNAI